MCNAIDDKIPWAIDGSLSLALQGTPVAPRDIDVLTTKDGAYGLQELLSEYVVKPVAFGSNQKYISHFGTLRIGNVNADIMGDLKIFRNGKWSDIQNPVITGVRRVKFMNSWIRVVPIEILVASGYLDERTKNRK